MNTKASLQNNIRYAIRLTQRTARLYRRIQSAGVFFSIVGGSATMTALASGLPHWLPVSGGVILALSGAALVAIRPSDKAAQNEADARRYQDVLIKSHTLDIAALELAIEEAHRGDCQEVEPLRAIAYNDVALELNRPDAAIPLTFTQKIIGALA